MYLTDLADVLRKAGLKVVEVDGWKTRGHGPMKRVTGIVWHHTATPASYPGDYPSLRVVRDGHSKLPGPLCNLGLGRNGTYYVVAAGFGYHAGAVKPQYVDVVDNDTAIGIEAENDGLSGVWPKAQYDAYVAGAAALSAHYGVPVSRNLGHKEISTAGKIDPHGIDMSKARAAVQAAFAGADVGTKKPDTKTTSGTKTAGVYSPGDTGDDVKQFQQELNTHWLRPKGWALLAEDGSYGPSTEAIVRAFQKAEKLEVDGYAGPATQAAMVKKLGVQL